MSTNLKKGENVQFHKLKIAGLLKRKFERKKERERTRNTESKTKKQERKISKCRAFITRLHMT